MSNRYYVLTLAASVVVASILSGGIYEGVSAGDRNAYVVNRWTGTAFYCTASGPCR